MSEKIQIGGRYFFFNKAEQFAEGIVDRKSKVCTFIVIKILTNRIVATYNRTERSFKKGEWTAMHPISKERILLI